MLFQIVLEHLQRTDWESNISGIIFKWFNPLAQ